MIASIPAYKNIYFDFYINFPDKWNFRTKTSAQGNFGMQYQINDDDLPDHDGEYKVLFFATYRRDSKLIERCNFFVSVHRLKNFFDLLLFAKNKEGVTNCDYSSKVFLGRDAQEVSITQEYNGKKIITKVIVWMERPEIWLSAIAEGDSLHNFEEAERLFHKMHRIAS